MVNSNRLKCGKPFVKWAGGKGQLLSKIREKYPDALGVKINRYCEPFVGGGAVLFDILANYELKEVMINDINSELTNTYICIRDNVDEVIDILLGMQEAFISLGNIERKKYYNEMRDLFNKTKKSEVVGKNPEKAALFIFLNKTCFNGLFRVNSRAQFNVPIGSYKNPVICNSENLFAVSRAMKNVEIRCGDYKKCSDFIDRNTFVYIDPPYRPLTRTAKFTSYFDNIFDDNEQISLKNFVDGIDKVGAKILLSNSDPKNTDKNDNFFDSLYRNYDIKRICARRMINSDAGGRGKISELLITNF